MLRTRAIIRVDSDFVLGAEESHGLLLTPDIRDKDATGAALLLAELASKLKSQGKTIYDYLTEIYLEYGYYYTGLSEIRMLGAKGMEDMQRIMKSLRSSSKTEIGGSRILKFFDHLDETGHFGKIQSDTDKSSRNVLVYHFMDALLILRPSGTEPKLKIYTEVKTSPLGMDASMDALDEKKASAKKEAIKLERSISKEILAILGIDLPDYALLVSNLVPLSLKIDFSKNFINELINKTIEIIDDVDELTRWIDNRLKSYGQDPRMLVKEAIVAYLESTGGANLNEKTRKILFEIFT